jgi:hypothetical protein
MSNPRLAVLALVLTFCLGALLGYFLRREEPPLPQGPYELAERLRDKGFVFQAVRASKDGDLPELYLTNTGKTWDELVALPRSPQAAERWKRTVHVNKAVEGGMHPPEETRLGNLCLYGDPELVAGIVRAFR